MTPADPLAPAAPAEFPARTLALGLLAGHVAHELNNLLTAVLGYGELLLGDLAEGERPRADAQRIVEAAQRARELSVGVLALPRDAEAARRVELGAELEAVRGLLGAVLPSSVDLRPGAGGRGLEARLEPGLLRASLLALGAALIAALRDEGGWLEIDCRGEPSPAASPGEGPPPHPPAAAPARHARITVRHAGQGPLRPRAAEDLRLAHALLAAFAARCGGRYRTIAGPEGGACELELPLEP